MKIAICLSLAILVCVFPLFAQTIWPEDLEYLGAFRLPEGPEEIGWEWCGEALAYWPEGNLDGASDGFPGSLFGVGHNWNTWVSEISIPVPVISPSRNVDELNTAQTLQPFADIRAGLFGYLEIPRAGIEVMPAMGEQSSPKLYFCWAQHMGEGDTGATHGWCELELPNPQTAGLWQIGGLWNYITTDYLFAAPQSWADAYTDGKSLMTGRFRDGGQGSMGPTLIAIAPWQSGNPPPENTVLETQTLLQYCSVYENCVNIMNAYHHSDEWSGGAWIGLGDKTAVVFAGTKGLGECWYGLVDGTVWEEPYPNNLPDSLLETRGWWSEAFVGEMLFYNPHDFEAVAKGEMHPWEPQPYAVLQLDDVLFHITGDRQKWHVGAVTADRQHGLIYLMEPLADGDKSLIHVWRIDPQLTHVRGAHQELNFHLSRNYPNPFNPVTRLTYSIENACDVQICVYSLKGELVFESGRFFQQGSYSLEIDASSWSSGVYWVKMIAGNCQAVRKITVLK